MIVGVPGGGAVGAAGGGLLGVTGGSVGDDAGVAAGVVTCDGNILGVVGFVGGWFLSGVASPSIANIS